MANAPIGKANANSGATFGLLTRNMLNKLIHEADVSEFGYELADFSIDNRQMYEEEAKPLFTTKLDNNTALV